MPKIYFYKLVVDDGGAPCVENGILSLAICKPNIRSAANENDILIGFAGNSLHADNRLLYVARVTEKLANGDYFRLLDHTGRSDCIYEWTSDRFAARPGAKYHGSPEDMKHDLGQHPGYPRANTLLSREFCYFGKSGSAAYKSTFPEIANAVAALTQGHRVNHNAGLFVDLDALAKQQCLLNGPCVRGCATSKPSRSACHRGGRFVVVEPHS